MGKTLDPAKARRPSGMPGGGWEEQTMKVAMSLMNSARP